MRVRVTLTQKAFEDEILRQAMRELMVTWMSMTKVDARMLDAHGYFTGEVTKVQFDRANKRLHRHIKSIIDVLAPVKPLRPAHM